MAIEKKKIIIVGCGPGAEEYITPAARAAAGKAEVLIVSQRLKDLFPECPAERIDSGTDVAGILDNMASRRDDGRQVVLLATGDPGIASLAQPVIRRFGRKNCEVIPGISSVQVAFARLGLGWQDARIVTAHSRNPQVSAADLCEARKIAILGGRPEAITWTAGLIAELGGDRRVFVCEELTLPGEQVYEVSADELTTLPVSSRAIILIIKGEVFS
ncbi:MAG: precorrin-6y C5,15-methyltransferase (decarboxylating) subunit CbiE [Deltaproteobacteria bacterium]|nr:precorrin-6y C5,15-methyltransferase (decarboxylating) subunit CbiE [Deltaproteobacteria bacterium]